MTYETAFTYLKVRPEQQPIANHARRMALLTFGCNLNVVECFTQYIKLFDISDKEGIRSAIKEVKIIRKKNKNPSLVEPSEGWSPSNTQELLAEYDLKTEDYHRTPWQWIANSPFKEMQNNGLVGRPYHIASQAMKMQ